MADFKDMLKFYRKRAGLSQSELADKLGLAASTISMYEVGSRQPNFETEESIADFFNVDLNALRGKDSEGSDVTNNLSLNEQSLVNMFRGLNAEGQEKVLEYAEDLESSGRYKKHDSVSKEA